MTNLDLSKYLDEQTFENPFLETEDSNSNFQNDNLDDNKLKQNETNIKNEVDKTLETGSALSDDPTSNEDFDNRFDCNLVEYDGPSQINSQFQGSTSNTENILEVTVEDHPNSLYQHVEKQIFYAFQKPEEKFIAIKFLEHLEPSGWLGKSIYEISIECGISEKLAEEILSRLQSFEPAGLFARDLKECLLIQAKANESYDLSLEILLQNLNLLAKGDLKTLAKKCNCKLVDITNYLKLIRSFNPKPGSMFDNDLPQINSPDLIVKKTKNGWSVDLNKSTLPTVFVNEDYANSINSKSKNNKNNNAFANQALASARWLKRALQQRNTTTLKISAEIVRRQTDFLENGLDFLKPLL